MNDFIGSMVIPDKRKKKSLEVVVIWGKEIE